MVKVHFVGLGGIGMSGLARLLLHKKVQISGSDRKENDVIKELTKNGVTFSLGHNKNNIEPGMTVIYSSDIPQDNEEMVAARNLLCTILHRSELLEQLMQEKKSLAVAGTHGKTTTSSLLTYVLKVANMDPTFMVGGIVRSLGVNADHGEGAYFVAETDESDGSFLRTSPYGAIITNIDADHLNYWGSMEALIKGFSDFASLVYSSEHLFWCKDDQTLQSLQLPGISYGFHEKADLQIVSCKNVGWKMVFSLRFQGKLYENIELSLLGKHNVLNATAVFGLALQLGAAEENIRKAFLSFKGVKRRAEIRGEVHAVTFVDDYAHHPTEIRATLKAIRGAVGPRRIIVIYQPHRYSRMQYCIGTFGNCFHEADKILVTEIYASNEKPIPGVHHDKVLEEVGGSHVMKEHLTEELKKILRPFDVVVTLGAGDITTECGRFVTYFENAGVQKYKVAIVTGGTSCEHEVAKVSSQYVIASLKKEHYQVSTFEISKEGEWSFEGITFSGIPEALFKADVVFPVLHGPGGEDGTLQGMLELAQIPFVGCSQLKAAVCMDKALTKKLALFHSIRTAPFVPITLWNWREDEKEPLQRIKEHLKYPLFVKASHLGSSLGVIKVEKEEDLTAAIESVFTQDYELIVEQGIKGREIEFAVMGNRNVVAFPPGEILTHGRVYDYDAKYAEDCFATTVDPKLSPELVTRGVEIAAATYRAIGCEGMARVDFFLDDQDKYWLNEINPIPGFTPISMFPKICERHGLKAPELMDQLLLLGLERGRIVRK